MRLSIKALFLLGVLTACQQQYPQGERIYRAYCANCHMEDGTGLVWLIPPLADADYLKTNRADVACIIRYGGPGGLVVNGTTYREPMPSFKNLNEVELSNLINYINTTWGNDNPETSPEKVLADLEQCAEN